MSSKEQYPVGENSLSPEMLELAEYLKLSIAEKFAIDVNDLGLLQYGETGDKWAVALTSESPFIMGSYAKIMRDTEKNKNKFMIDIQGVSIDTRSFGLEHYEAMIAQAVIDEPESIPDSSSLVAKGKVWTGTWLTGAELTNGGLAQFACVFGEQGQVYQNWIPANTKSKRYGFRPLIELTI